MKFKSIRFRYFSLILHDKVCVTRSTFQNLDDRISIYAHISIYIDHTRNSNLFVFDISRPFFMIIFMININILCINIDNMYGNSNQFVPHVFR